MVLGFPQNARIKCTQIAQIWMVLSFPQNARIKCTQIAQILWEELFPVDVLRLFGWDVFYHLGT